MFTTFRSLVLVLMFATVIMLLAGSRHVRASNAGAAATFSSYLPLVTVATLPPVNQHMLTVDDLPGFGPTRATGGNDDWYVRSFERPFMLEPVNTIDAGPVFVTNTIRRYADTATAQVEVEQLAQSNRQNGWQELTAAPLGHRRWAFFYRDANVTLSDNYFMLVQYEQYRIEMSINGTPKGVSYAKLERLTRLVVDRVVGAVQ